MDASTITPTSVVLSRKGRRVNATVTYSGSTATLDPARKLKAGTRYRLTIAGTVEDLTGNALAAPYVRTFKTRG
jgi:hypothetical protein